jgi:hypothetical protein
LITVRYIDDRKKESAKQAILDVFAVYSRFGCKVTTILWDGEGAVSSLKTTIELLGVQVEQCAKNEHVPTIERAIRQLKERVRAYWNTLPFKLTHLMLIHLVYHLVSRINQIPRSTSAIEGVSPLKKLTGKDVDYSIECALEFGDFVQANEDNTVTNTMAARTFPAICLGPARNLQGSYFFLNLLTWSVMKRRGFTKFPLSNEFISRINAKASRDWAVYGRDGLTFRYQHADIINFEDDQDDREEPDNTPEVTPIPEVTIEEEVANLPQPDTGNVPDYFQEEAAEEVDYEPHYFTEEPVEPVVQFDEAVQQETPYNLRNTPERRARRGQLGLLQNTILSTYNVSKGVKEWGKEVTDSMRAEIGGIPKN